MIRKCLFTKYAGNPVLSAQDFPAEIMYTHNPGAIKFNGEYLLLVDAATGATPIVLWIARSKDGIHFTPDPEPVDWPPASYREDCIYDPRITYINGEYVIMYGSLSNELGVRVGVVKTRDFVHFERIDQQLGAGQCRNAALFPEKINGKYVRFDRPMTGELDPADMCISYSDDLRSWGDSKVLMSPRQGCWDSHKLGAGAVPIRTRQGWLEIYHGVDNSSCNNSIYRLGTVMLDLNDPSKIISRAELPVLWPENLYELVGRTPNVVFTANALVEPDNKVRLYYGAADTCVGMAEADLDEVIAFTMDGKNHYRDKFFKLV